MKVMELLPLVRKKDERIQIIDKYGAIRTCAPAEWLDPQYLERDIYQIYFYEGTIAIEVESK